MGNSSRRHALRRTYLSLGLGELAAVAVFLYASMSVLLPGIRLHGGERALWLALIPLVVILTQAGAYWLLARGWVPGGRMPRLLAAAYRTFRVFDAILLLASLAGVLLWRPAHTGWALLVSGIWLFGVVEYVNYFVWRLSYPPREWLHSVR